MATAKKRKGSYKPARGPRVKGSVDRAGRIRRQLVALEGDTTPGAWTRRQNLLKLQKELKKAGYTG